MQSDNFSPGSPPDHSHFLSRMRNGAAARRVNLRDFRSYPPCIKLGGEAAGWPSFIPTTCHATPWCDPHRNFVSKWIHYNTNGMIQSYRMNTGFQIAFLVIIFHTIPHCFGCFMYCRCKFIIAKLITLQTSCWKVCIFFFWSLGSFNVSSVKKML